jgi:hypothetical protein
MARHIVPYDRGPQLDRIRLPECAAWRTQWADRRSQTKSDSCNSLSPGRPTAKALARFALGSGLPQLDEEIGYFKSAGSAFQVSEQRLDGSST